MCWLKNVGRYIVAAFIIILVLPCLYLVLAVFDLFGIKK